METSIDLSKQAFKNEIVVDNDTHKIGGEFLHLNQRQLTIEFNITRLFNLIFYISVGLAKYFRV